LNYPPAALAALAQRLQGNAKLTCTITPSGQASQCAITSTSNPVFGIPALTFALNATYLPALANGTPTTSPMSFTIGFTLSPQQADPTRPLRDAWHSASVPYYPYAATLHNDSGIIRVTCTIDTLGIARNCTADGKDPDLRTVAQAFIENSRYYPAMKNGQLIETTSTTSINFSTDNTPRNDGFNQ